MDRLTVAEVDLMTALLLVNLYLWLSLVAEVRKWHRRLTANRFPEGGHRPPDCGLEPPLVTALRTGLTSVWMLVVLLPVY
ncbi:hypothetical protein [Vibrio sp.]|uniref:hypothetical protein n=1 Tax=Vibrio sp. TaxID=678 RepID=UPI003AA7CDEC